MPIDMSGDLAMVDGLVTVRYRVYGTTANRMADALRVSPRRRDPIDSKAGALEIMAVWRVGALDINGISPRPGDAITDRQGVVWTVLESTYHHLIQQWELRCTNLSLYLTTRIRVEVRTEEQDAVGSLAWVWSTVGEGAPDVARIHPFTGTSQLESNGRRRLEPDVRIVVNTSFKFTDAMRIVDARTNEIYEVLGYDNPDSFEFLQVLRGRRHVPD
jgi:hypothetical protein